MRTHLLHLFTAVAAISVLLFASVAYAQDEPPRGPSVKDEQGEWLEPPPVIDEPLPACWDMVAMDNVGLASNGWTQELCEARGYTWLPECFWGPCDEAVETPETQPEPTVVEPAPVEQAPTAELPATQPAQAQQGSPRFTG